MYYRQPYYATKVLVAPQSMARIYNLMSSTDCFGIQVTTRYLPRAICARRRTYARRRRDITRDNNGDLYPGIRATSSWPGCDRSRFQPPDLKQSIPQSLIIREKVLHLALFPPRIKVKFFKRLS